MEILQSTLSAIAAKNFKLVQRDTVFWYGSQCFDLCEFYGVSPKQFIKYDSVQYFVNDVGGMLAGYRRIATRTSAPDPDIPYGTKPMSLYERVGFFEEVCRTFQHDFNELANIYTGLRMDIQQIQTERCPPMHPSPHTPMYPTLVPGYPPQGVQQDMWANVTPTTSEQHTHRGMIHWTPQTSTHFPQSAPPRVFSPQRQVPREDTAKEPNPRETRSDYRENRPRTRGVRPRGNLRGRIRPCSTRGGINTRPSEGQEVEEDQGPNDNSFFDEDVESILSTDSNKFGLTIEKVREILGQTSLERLTRYHSKNSFDDFSEEFLTTLHGSIMDTIFETELYPQKKFHRGDQIPQSQFDRLAEELKREINPYNAYDKLSSLERTINNLQAFIIGGAADRIPLNVGMDAVTLSTNAQRQSPENEPNQAVPHRSGPIIHLFES
ncbi:MAG: hypothetical protein [Bat faecal associated anphe-like virus 1]|uniref:Uncharacterized protein n=1 Tax=Bat faecal associated anphe-like virus 1 TaxID=2972716 RepID=A0AAE9NIP7_9MONO|nr:MAG: hypothetical protein [Bat faecal associated anphe-like virus 1]